MVKRMNENYGKAVNEKRLTSVKGILLQSGENLVDAYISAFFKNLNTVKHLHLKL